ncbi:L-arabinose isomerase, partial [bacterium]
MKASLKKVEIWFVTGSQHLYGEETLRKVAEHSERIATALDGSDRIPVQVVFKPVLTDPEGIRQLLRDADASESCAGLVLWMHTFSPAKMWITGLKGLRKPVLHLHTQFNRDLPWDAIDMDFMNLNQAAHGDREAGHLHARMGLARKVVVGHWGEDEVQDRIGAWARVVRAWHDLQGARFARFGDNMREVSVTDGDKVSAEMAFGFSTNGYGVGDLAAFIQAVP